MVGLAVVIAVAGGCGSDDASDSTAATTAPSSSTTGSGSGSDGDTTSTDSGATGPGTTASVTTSVDTTGDSATGTDTTGPGAEPCAEGHVCFFLDGVFHQPDEANPTAIYDIPLPRVQDFRIVEVELSVTHGGWFPEDPAGLHNLFWLHRGTFDDFTWMGGVIGYVNARGPGTNVIRTRHDLDVTDLADSQTFNINGVSLQEGSTYRVFYRYDTDAAEVLVEITEGGEVVAQGTDVPTTDLVRNTDGSVFIYFANGTDVAAPGPEVPSLGWTFADLRVELIP